MNKKRYSQLCVAVILMLLIGPLVMPDLVGRADIGFPPVNPAGSSVGPQGDIQTNVRMVSEEVSLTIEPYERPVPENQIDSPAYWMRGLVEAQFVMRNLGEAQEAFDVWFPLAASTRYPDILSYDRTIHPENIVQDFKVWVDGLPTETQQVAAPDLSIPEQESTWAKFPMVFPAGQDVVVHVNYTIYPGGRRPFGDFEYILQTGAGWKDTIGEATITINLPDTVTSETVSLEGTDILGYPLAPQPEGYKVENNTITWHFTDLEPGAEDNIFIDVLEPGRYRRLVQARGQTQSAPDSTEAQLQLARAARDAILVIKSVGQNGGGAALAQEANAAYARALELSPERPEPYSEYARWLMANGGGRQLFVEGTCAEVLCDLVKQGLEKFPNDAELKKIDEEIRMMLEEAALNATQQAQENPSPVPTETPVSASPTPLSTAAPTATRLSPQPSPTVVATGSKGLCPAGLFPLAILVGLLGLVYYHQLHR